MTALDALARTPPNDPMAEAALLGACLMDSSVMAEISLSGQDFYALKHQLVWQALCDVVAHDGRADMTTVHARLQEAQHLSQVGGVVYLSDLQIGTNPASATHYAAIVKDRALRRKIIDASVRASQEAYESQDAAEDIAARVEAGFTSAVPDKVHSEQTMDFDEFLAQPVPEHQWVVPNLLAKGDRLVLTGFEGLGKSVLMRQLLVCAAAGMDPFRGFATRPAKCLLVDCENPKSIMIASLARLRSAVETHMRRKVDPKRLKVQRRPEGIDLGSPVDRLWLQRLVAKHQPDLLAIGPAYKMHMGGAGAREEDLARQVASTLDHIREQVGCAVILEHHSPHTAPGAKTRSVRPIGSTLWLRWPEFGIGICYAQDSNAVKERRVELQHWRGQREMREWPVELMSGGDGMPWVETSNSFPLKGVA
jgi:hypothetical protein